MPVLDQDFHLIQLLAQRIGGAQPERIVVIVGLPRIQHTQPILHRQPRGHDKHHAREVLVSFGVRQRVQHLPGDDQRHHGGFAAACGHLVAQAFPCATIAGHVDALLVIGRRFHPPDQRFNRLQLAEVKRIHPRGAVVPVFQQGTRHTGDARIIRRAPRVHALADGVHQIQRLGAPRVITNVEDFVTSGAPLGHQRQCVVACLQPVLRRALVGRVDDQGCGGGHRQLT